MEGRGRGADSLATGNRDTGGEVGLGRGARYTVGEPKVDEPRASRRREIGHTKHDVRKQAHDAAAHELCTKVVATPAVASRALVGPSGPAIRSATAHRPRRAPDGRPQDGDT